MCVVSFRSKISLTVSGRHVACLLSIGFILGNMIKNIYCIPRPPPPVQRLRDMDSDDYSFPSTHSVQAAAVPTWIMLNLFSTDDGTYPLYLLVPIVMTLSFCISTSRIYLGAHTLQDVIAGYCIGLFLSLSYFSFTLKVEFLLSYGSYMVPLSILLWNTILILIHPIEYSVKHSTGKYNLGYSQSGYLTSTGLCGVIMGTTFGSWMFPDSHENIALTVFQVVLRYMVGVICCAVVYLVSKLVLRELLLNIYKTLKIPLFDPPYHGATTEKEQEEYEMRAKIHKRTCVGSGIQVMPAVKFVQYTGLAFMIMTGCPLIFKYLRI